LSFDPNESYDDYTNSYYTLWHQKRGQWFNYGKLPSQRPIHYFRSRPTQVRLEKDKYGLKSGWHIFHHSSYQDSKAILRLRHVGNRIPENQSGYQEPIYLDENWEVLDAWIDPDWFYGNSTAGRGVYREDFGYVYGGWDRVVGQVGDWNESNPCTWMDCWDDGYYTIIECVPPPYESVPSAAMGHLAAWPGTWNTFINSFYQGYSNPSGWTDFKPIFFNPTSRDDSNPWNHIARSPAYQRPWMIHEDRDYISPPAVYKWRSNFWLMADAFDFEYYPDDDMYLPVSRNHIIYQGPYNWQTLNSSGETEPDIDTSIWDWEWDASCAESNLVSAYVRRKSDGSIWKFRNWNPGANIYTDFTNLKMRPENPIPGYEYASFFMNGPPIPGNETWNTLMILK
jgi:hypothetical protein